MPQADFLATPLQIRLVYKQCITVLAGQQPSSKCFDCDRQLSRYSSGAYEASLLEKIKVDSCLALNCSEQQLVGQSISVCVHRILEAVTNRDLFSLGVNLAFH